MNAAPPVEVLTVSKVEALVRNLDDVEVPMVPVPIVSRTVGADAVKVPDVSVPVPLTDKLTSVPPVIFAPNCRLPALDRLTLAAVTVPAVVKGPLADKSKAPVVPAAD